MVNKMITWENFLRQKIESSNPFEENEGYTLFFKKNNKYYAVKEEDRIIFAKIKTKDIKDLNADKNEIEFQARELKSGKIVHFAAEDLADIEVCEKEEAEENVPLPKER